MPAKTREDEHKWEKAKEVAKEQGHGEDYAYIMGVYKKMKPDYFKAAAVRVAATWLASKAQKEPTIKSVNMRAGTTDEWAILNISLTGEWPRPNGEAAEKELAKTLYEMASKMPMWSSALSRVPRTIETVVERDYDDDGDDDDDGYGRRHREPETRDTDVPRPRSWRDIEDWNVQADKATFTLANRD